MLTSRWHMHRMGLIDFWFYTNEEFYFKDGHMLLRGSNGSGKSVTLQSIIPLLLDGNKSSERLDSFGTRARKMETYLIDEDSDRNDRIGYLYLEFKREDSNLYKTIGMGLRARKNKPLESWYFVIEDNRRINKDIMLINNNLAIAKSTLKALIGDQLIESQKEYMARVNQALFHFSNHDEYKETVNLLVQLRSPKLSNSLKPTMINEILSRSLQPLSEEDLRPMSEALSNMDDIQDQLEMLKQGFQAANTIFKVYDQYNCSVLHKKAVLADEEQKRFENVQKQQKDFLHRQEENQQDLGKVLKQKEALLQEQTALKNEYSSLMKDDIIQLTNELEVHRKNHQEKQSHLQEKEKQLNVKEHVYFEEKSRSKKLKSKQEELDSDIHSIFQEMESLQENLQFEEQISLKEEFITHLDKEYDFTYTLNRVKEEITQLSQGIELFAQVDQEKRMLSRLNEENERKQQDYQDAIRQIEKLRSQLILEIEAYKEQISKWNESNHLLVLNSNELITILNGIEEEVKSARGMEDILQNRYQEVFKRLSQDLIQNQHEQKQLSKNIFDLEEELEHWQTMKDPSPTEDEQTKKSRSYLKEKNVRFKPLYAFLEYGNDVSAIQKDIFEEQLIRMGILNSLVMCKSDEEKLDMYPSGMADQFLLVENPIDTYKTCVLHSENDSINFTQVLKHFGWNTQAIQTNRSRYLHGLVTGIVSKERQSIYIGKESRELYRQNKIQELKQELSQYKQKLEVFLEEERKIQEAFKTLEEEKNAYPSQHSLNVIHREIEKTEIEQEAIFDQIQKLKEELEQCRKNVHALQLSLSKICERLGISMLKEVFENRKEDFEHYKSYVEDLKATHVRYLSNEEVLMMTQSRVEDLSQDVFLLNQEKNQLIKEIEMLKKMIESIQKQMDELGYQDIQDRIMQILDRQQQIPEEISKQDQKIGDLQQREEQFQMRLKELEETIQLQRKRRDETLDAFKQEQDLGYVTHEKLDVKETIGKIEKKYVNLRNKEVLQTELQNVFHNNKGQLQDYGLIIHNIFEEKEENTRMDIQTRYKGQNVSFIQLMQNLSQDIEQQKLLLEESDRNLIEDILVNTIAKKIRTHIQSSKRWVEQMNRYMRAMNTSSGLKLSLRWHSHKAESEEQLSTEQLVHLLEKDVQVLKEQDFKKLSSHFRSKLKLARKLADDEASLKSFHQVMREVLDYRTWFDFQIEYEKQGERKKELTNNAFFTFSGGEKAMAMYVPLFSAVAAKYEQASEDAPLIIALDEAFAGVDENNIENMFALIQKFGFDYIMNSQVLWGDYSSVPSLAIHELFRPENANFVTVISYEWNGKQKRMIA